MEYFEAQVDVTSGSDAGVAKVILADDVVEVHAAKWASEYRKTLLHQGDFTMGADELDQLIAVLQHAAGLIRRDEREAEENELAGRAFDPELAVELAMRAAKV